MQYLGRCLHFPCYSTLMKTINALFCLDVMQELKSIFHDVVEKEVWLLKAEDISLFIPLKIIKYKLLPVTITATHFTKCDRGGVTCALAVGAKKVPRRQHYLLLKCQQILRMQHLHPLQYLGALRHYGHLCAAKLYPMLSTMLLVERMNERFLRSQFVAFDKQHKFLTATCTQDHSDLNSHDACSTAEHCEAL